MADELFGEWKKPTDEEIQEWEEQKKLKDRISSEMGKYLLKGYRMLDKACSVCNTVLLQTKKGQNRCIYCEEILPTLRPKEEVQPRIVPKDQPTSPRKCQVEFDQTQPPSNCASSTSPVLAKVSSGNTDSSIRYAQNVVLAKLKSCAEELAECTSVEMSLQFCHLIRDLADTLAALNKAAC